MSDELVAVNQKILPKGLYVQNTGDYPSVPVDYEDGFVLPQHYTKPLQALLGDDKYSKNLRFFEEEHIYTYLAVPMSTSVTPLAHQFEDEFNADAAISSMQFSRSQAWPRKSYVTDLKKLSVCDTDILPANVGALLEVGGLTVASFSAHSMMPNMTVEQIKELLCTSTVKSCEVLPEPDELQFFTFARGMNAQEIKDMWKKKGLLARNKGTDAHFQAELFCNGLPCRWWEPEMEVLINFVKEHVIPNGLVVFNTEKEIVCADADVAGSIDLILYDPVKELYHILDHKRSDKLKQDLRGYRKMKRPMTHLDSCKGAGYALQTSIYQYILERDYDMKFGDRVLLSLHPDAPFVTSVPYLHEEAKYIIDTQIACVQARRAVAEQNPKFRCALTDAPLVNAVRISDGRLVMEKVAQLRNAQYVPETTVREAFDRLVQEELKQLKPPVGMDRGRLTSWRALVPESGSTPFAN